MATPGQQSEATDEFDHLVSAVKHPTCEWDTNGQILRDHEIKDTILEDARDFLRSTSWYADRGIPFRRGRLAVL